jgi:hypothetical protein
VVVPDEIVLDDAAGALEESPYAADLDDVLATDIAADNLAAEEETPLPDPTPLGQAEAEVRAESDEDGPVVLEDFRPESGAAGHEDDESPDDSRG